MRIDPPGGARPARRARHRRRAETLRHVDRIAHDGGLEGLREIKAPEVDLAEDLFADSVPAPDVQALLADINRDIHRRVLAAALKDMAEFKAGKPVGNYLHPRRMGKPEREQLIRALKAIRMLAEAVHLEFRGEVFSRGWGRGGLAKVPHDRLETAM